MVWLVLEFHELVEKGHVPRHGQRGGLDEQTPALFRWEASMTAFNVVRLRVKPVHEQECLDAHQPQNVRSKWRGGNESI